MTEKICALICEVAEAKDKALNDYNEVKVRAQVTAEKYEKLSGLHHSLCVARDRAVALDKETP